MSIFHHDNTTTKIYTLSLHDALPICSFREALDVHARIDDRWGLTLVVEGIGIVLVESGDAETGTRLLAAASAAWLDRKSTRLNSSHGYISYAVFCLKKRRNRRIPTSN